LAFAGLWRRSRLADGTAIDTCAILTMTAHGSIEGIHHRMPIILPPEAFDAWLDPQVTDVERLREILVPEKEENLEFYEIGRAVNNPGNDDPRLIEPAQAPPPPRPAQGSLF
jgi:putative SOS response-associated peptidase YedK